MDEHITATECRDSEELFLDAWVNYWKSLDTGVLTPMIHKLEEDLDICQKQQKVHLMKRPMV